MKELLLLLCRYPWNDNRREKLEDLLGKVSDWPLLAGLLNAHGIISLAYYNICESGLTGLVPGATLSYLEQGYRKNMVRNIWLRERWKELDDILSLGGIEYVLLKGMALEHTHYGSKGLRQMSDIDILIRPSEALRAWELLRSRGYAMKPLKSPLFRTIIMNMGQHLPALFREGCAIEIHDSLGGEDPGLKDPFTDLKKIEIEGRKAYVLPDMVHLGYLVSHFTRHAGSGECPMRSYADLMLMGCDDTVSYPENYLLRPIQGSDPFYRRKSFRAIARSLPLPRRIIFILGDIFPSPSWMRERYGITGARVFLKYPRRAGKLLWLFGGDRKKESRFGASLIN